jgi:hypothetical protein
MHATKLFGAVWVAAGLTVASIALAGAASAKPLERGEFHEETTEIVEDFCDVPGLTVQVDSTTEGRFMLNPHGPDGLAYGLEHLEITDVFTNLDNGNDVTGEQAFLSKDLRVTDNGDGTLTILGLNAGRMSVVYGPDGKAIARGPGQIRFELLIDNGGTPSDPFDDEFLEFLGIIKGPTGRTDDFCAAVVPVLMS